MKKYDCIFLDRDGTINFDSGYLSTIKDFKLYDFTIPALKKLARLGNKFCIITNQSGVNRGLIKKKDLLSIHNFIEQIFEKSQIPLLKIYTCFDHPDDSTERRKPGSGMFYEAKNDFGFDLKNCLMIGDSYADIKAGILLEMDTMLVLTGHGERTLSVLKKDEIPTFVAKNLKKGVEKLCL